MIGHICWYHNKYVTISHIHYGYLRSLNLEVKRERGHGLAAKRALQHNHSFPTFRVSLLSPLYSQPPGSFCPPSSSRQSVTTPYKKGGGQWDWEEWRELERAPKQSTKKGNENCGGTEQDHELLGESSVIKVACLQRYPNSTITVGVWPPWVSCFAGCYKVAVF